MRTSIILGLFALLATPATSPAQHRGDPPREPLRTSSVPQWTPPREPLRTWSVQQWTPKQWTPTQWTLPTNPRVGLTAPPVHPRLGFDGPRSRSRRIDGRNDRGLAYSPYSAYSNLPVVVYMTAPPAIITVPVRDPEPPRYVMPAKGNLILEVEPGNAQVFVDGYYAGSADDFNSSARSLALDVGPHTIELDGPVHEAVRFQVMTTSNDSITYRRELTPVNVAPPAGAIVSPPVPLYMIPGCYLGNVPPKDAGLPATCDPARAVRLR